MTPDTATPQTPHIPDDDLVLFALQLLPEDRMIVARQHMDGCEPCRGEVARFQGDLVTYSITADIQTPPPVARERLMRQIAKEPRTAAPEPVSAAAAPDHAQGRAQARSQVRAQGRPQAPASDESVLQTRQNRLTRVEAGADEADEFAQKEPKRPSRRAPWVLAWVGWALAASACFFAGLQFRQKQQMQSSIADQQAQLDQTTTQMAHSRDALATLTAANAIQVVLHTPAAAVGAKPTAPKAGTPTTPSPEALAAYLADKGALVFVATHLEAPPAGKTYELWLLPADGRNPMPAGTFKPDAQGAASVVMPKLPTGVPAKGFGVTVENDGGSDAPTSPIMLASS